MYKALVLILSIVTYNCLAQTKSQVPNGIKSSKIGIIKYSLEEFKPHYHDSTTGQWVINRYGYEKMYQNYLEGLDEIASRLQKAKINYVILTSKKEVNNQYEYLIDYNETVLDNSTSIVADRHVGGFYFIELKSGLRFAPFDVSRWTIKRVFKSI